MVVFLRVVAVYLLPSFSDLLGYVEFGFALDNPFDARLLTTTTAVSPDALGHTGRFATSVARTAIRWDA